MKHQTRDVLYYTHCRKNRPTLRVRPGETFTVDTELCSGDWLRSIDDEYDPSKAKGPNPSSGCVFVESAVPGNMLAVTVESIEPESLGFTGSGPGANPFPDWIRQKEWGGVVAKTVAIRDGFVEWSDDLRIPVRPMIGVLGTAPEREEYLNSHNGTYGGNLDAQEVRAGATIYLPVYVEGALLHVGDVHAIQGDGEICCGGGIECRSTVRLTVEVLPRPRRMSWPRFADATHIGVFACARPAEDAFRLAVQELIYWLADDYGWDEREAYLLLGQILEARCTQFVDPLFTYVAKVAAEYLPGCPPSLATT